jgi:DMSO/TMAO reductase YedYZ molybdopterin-dependent catalytic subunit
VHPADRYRVPGAFLHEVLEQARPAANALDVKFEGAEHGPYYQLKDIAFTRSLTLAHAAIRRQRF